MPYARHFWQAFSAPAPPGSHVSSRACIGPINQRPAKICPFLNLTLFTFFEPKRERERQPGQLRNKSGEVCVCGPHIALRPQFITETPAGLQSRTVVVLGSVKGRRERRVAANLQSWALSVFLNFFNNKK